MGKAIPTVYIFGGEFRRELEVVLIEDILEYFRESSKNL